MRELKLPEADIRAIDAYFAPPALVARPEGDEAVKLARLDSQELLANGSTRTWSPTAIPTMPP